MSAHRLSLPSGLCAYVDPTLLPDDLVEVLAARGALVIARASGPEAVIHLDEEARVVRVERDAPPLAPVPEDAVVVDLGRFRYERLKAGARGLLAGVVTMLPLVATVPPLVRLG